MPELPTISLHYWAGARAAAGCEVEAFPVATIAEALAAARAVRADPHFDRVLSICSLLVDGVVVTGQELLRTRQESTEVEVLPPFAGGARPVLRCPLGLLRTDPWSAEHRPV